MDLFMDMLSEHPMLEKRYFKGGPRETQSNLWWNLTGCSRLTPQCAAITHISVHPSSVLADRCHLKSFGDVPQLFLWKNWSKMSLCYWNDFSGKGLLIPFHCHHLCHEFWTILVFRRFCILFYMSSHLFFPIVLLGFKKKLKNCQSSLSLDALVKIFCLLLIHRGQQV